MSWDIEYTDQFEDWFNNLTPDQQDAVAERVALLEAEGPNLRRPFVGRIETSRHRNLKELICNEAGSLRVLFAFNPLRTAILLLGGDKTGEWKEWYRRAVPEADALYDEHLAELRKELLLE